MKEVIILCVIGVMLILDIAAIAYIVRHIIKTCKIIKKENEKMSYEDILKRE